MAMSEPILDYQTSQRNCQLRWDILNPYQYIINKVVLDIGCAQGWFVEKSLEYGAKKVIGLDIANYNWNGRGEYNILQAESFDISSDINVIFLMSVAIDINFIDKLKFNKNIETIFFEPYLDSENKSKWKEDEWLQKFREAGFDFYQTGISERERNLYILRRTSVYMIVKDGTRYAIKENVDNNEIEFYNKFGCTEYVLPYQLETVKDNTDNAIKSLILPWSDTTLRLSDKNSIDYLENIEKAINWIHSLGIVHGDLRISNIVIYRNKPYLIDFSYWHYGNIREDDGNSLSCTFGKRGFEYIKNAILSGKLRYLE